MENYFNRIVELFVKSDVSPSLQADFYRWLADEKFSRKKEEALYNLWEKMTENRDTESDTSVDTWRSLAKVNKRIRESQGNAHRKLLRFWQISAACLIIAFISTLYFTHTTKREAADLIEQYVPIAGMGHLTLPDGTEVQMNSTATLLYPEQFSGKNRSVYLIGEANFKVARNEKMPFIVKSNDFQVTALGTEFNLRAYPGDSTLSATLLSGSVEVKFNNLTSAQILKPNEQLTYNIFTKTESIHHPDISEVTAWQRGELIFKSTSLVEIITVLERRYPYSFVYALSSLKEDKYTFRFKENTSLTEVMDIIVRVSGSIKYRIEDDKCYITSI